MIRFDRLPGPDDLRELRPILSRDADATYWMSRYVERAENVARLLLMSTETLVDVRDLAPTLLDRHWTSVLRIMLVEAPPPWPESIAEQVCIHMTFREDNPNSLVSCLTRARENARGIREGISTDMWEHLNTLYWTIRSDDAAARFADTPAQLYQQIVTAAMTFHGLTDQTLPHDQRWHFAQLGRLFERIAFTCRVIQEKMDSVDLPLPPDVPIDSPFRNVHGISALRCCNSLEAFRRAYPGELNPAAISGYLLFDPHFPRSIRYCVAAAGRSAAAIRSEVRHRSVDPAERILGQLQARLDYADPAEILSRSLSSWLDDVQREIALAAVAIQKSYFKQ